MSLGFEGLQLLPLVDRGMAEEGEGFDAFTHKSPVLDTDVLS